MAPHIYVVVETDTLMDGHITDLIMAFKENERDRAYTYAKAQRDRAIRIHRGNVKFHVEWVSVPSEDR